MERENKNLYYWLAALMSAFVMIAYLYSGSVYDNVRYNVTRNEAIDIASDYVNNLNYDISDYQVESNTHVGNSVHSYFVKTLGNEGFNYIADSSDIPVFAWQILFHQNKKPDENGIEYRVRVSANGDIVYFSRDIPDTLTEKSVDILTAEEKVKEFVVFKTGLDLSTFSLVETKEDQKENRTDYTFKWEKEYKEYNGKLLLHGEINGDKPGWLLVRFELPDGESLRLESGQAIYGTASFIFVFFLTQFAVFIFLRKYHQGEVWLRIGRNLFLTYYILSLFALILGWSSIGEGVGMGTDLLTKKVVVFLSLGLLVLFLFALLIFSAWSAAESITRGTWNEKLRGIDAFIKFRYFSLSTGTALFRGLVTGSIITVSYFFVYRYTSGVSNSLYFTADDYAFMYNSYFPAASAFFEAFTKSILSAVVVQFFVVSLVYEKWKSKRLAIVISALVGVMANVISLSSPTSHLLSVDILIDFVYGLIFAWIFLQFDLLTLISTKFHIYVLKYAMMMYASENSFYDINFYLIAFIVVATILIFVIARVRKEEFVMENYGIPDHIQKITERERMRKELEIASHVQLSLLPKEQPEFPGYDVAGLSIPAKEAGGDYYDFVKLEKAKHGIAIGDVSGKGVGAAIYMTLTKGILQAHAEENVSPKSVLKKVNRLLYKTIEKNTFVSMFYSVLDTETNTMLYSRAGHNPGIFCTNVDGETRLLKSSGIALGLEEGQIFSKTLVEETIQIDKGDTVVLYTDGFTEAMNPALEEFGEDRLNDLIKENRHVAPSALLELILQKVTEFTQDHPQHDDMTLVIVKRKE